MRLVHNALQVTQNRGVRLTAATASSAAIALPTNDAGEKPKYVAVTTGHEPMMIAFGLSGMADAGISDFMVPADACEIFNVTGCTHYRHERAGSTDALFSIYAIENEGGQAAPAGTP